MKKRTNFKITVCLFIAFLMVNFVPGLFRHVPVITDEINPLAPLMRLRGYDWSKYLAADGFYYKPGILIWYAPFIFFVKSSVVQFRAMLFVNCIFASLIPVFVYFVLNRWNGHSIRYNILTATLTGIVPAVLLNSNYIWAEPVIMLAPWGIVLVFCFVGEINSITKYYKNALKGILLAIISCYAYFVHNRGIVFVIAVFLTILYGELILKDRSISLVAFLISVLFCMVIDNRVQSYIKNVVYVSTNELAGNSLGFLSIDALAGVLTTEGLKTISMVAIGWLFASFSSTYGLSIVGLFICLKTVFSKNDFKSKITQKEISFFTLLCFFGALMLGVLFFFQDNSMIMTGETYKRADKLIYVRYIDAANIMLSFHTIRYLLSGKRNKKLLYHSVVVFYLCFYFYMTFLSDLLNNTISYPNNLQSVNYFFNYAGVVRGGMYSPVNNLGKSIVAFGLFSFVVFIVWAFVLKDRFKQIILLMGVCLIGYFWNSYNVTARMDNYAYHQVHRFEDVIKLAEHMEIDKKNIYLDDEIMRCSYQFFFPDYRVLTKRDQDLFDVENMFLISEKGKYNFKLYQNDFYKISNQDALLEYEIYVKGSEMMRILSKNGLVFEKIADPVSRNSAK